MSKTKLFCVLFLIFGASTHGFAQYTMERQSISSEGGSNDYYVGLEVKPLNSIMYASPGGYGYGGELEFSIFGDVVLTAGYTALGANPTDEEFTKKMAEKKPDDDDLVVRRSEGSLITGGLRWYPDRKNSSFYCGARLVSGRSSTDYTFTDETSLNEKITFMGPGIELGYRWLLSMVSIRLGISGHAEGNRKSEFSSDDEYGEFEVAQAKIEKDNKKNKNQSTAGASIDFGLGVVF